MSITPARITGVVVAADGSHGSYSIETAEDDLADGLDLLLLRLLESAPEPFASGRDVSGIVFDVSDLLEPRSAAPTTLVRIAPRPPADADHEIRSAPDLGQAVNILHAAGGHTTLGDELVRLDADAIRRAAEAVPRGLRYVITSVGSLVNPAHEIRAGEILLEHAEPSSIEYSHSFASSSFAVRERTALANSLLIPPAASLATMIALAAGKRAPQARLYVTTNDGGCAPLARLPLAPVHSALSGSPVELIGAAALCGIYDGSLIVADGDRVFLGELVDGVPTVVPQLVDRFGSSLATQTANILPVTDSQLSGRVEAPLLVVRGSDGAAVEEIGVPVRARTALDLRALGAACASLADWVNRVVNVGNASEMEQALAAAKARVGARLVSFGAAPSQVRITEARAVATAYESPRVVSVRVRGVAGERPSTQLTDGCAA